VCPVTPSLPTKVAPNLPTHVASNLPNHVVLGCGDIGRRIVKQLQLEGVANERIIAYVNSESSFDRATELGIAARYFELDPQGAALSAAHDLAVNTAVNSLAQLNSIADIADSHAYYTVAPQITGEEDKRSRALIRLLEHAKSVPSKMVLISTTGVYGDAQGSWIDETHAANPSTDRAKRRYDSEAQWQAFMSSHKRVLTVLRVPGIYARSRLPQERIKKAIPVVRSEEVGFTNRIHADDLAAICVCANQRLQASTILNATDGKPGTITQYLQAVADYLGEPKLPEITLDQAHSELSEGMLSYLSESRKISNAKLLDLLDYTFLYPDFRIGMKY